MLSLVDLRGHTIDSSIIVSHQSSASMPSLAHPLRRAREVSIVLKFVTSHPGTAIGFRVVASSRALASGVDVLVAQNGVSTCSK